MASTPTFPHGMGGARRSAANACYADSCALARTAADGEPAQYSAPLTGMPSSYTACATLLSATHCLSSPLAGIGKVWRAVGEASDPTRLAVGCIINLDLSL